MLKGQNITIVGAGIGGLTAAVALARRGAQVKVLEKAPEIREVGAGLQISPNGVAVLDALGLGDVARSRAVASDAIALRDGPSGRAVIDLDLSRYDALGPFLMFHRADLVAMLAEAARDAGATIATGRELTEVETGDEATSLTFADGSREEVGFLVAADGLHSVLRPVLNGPQRPFFTGQVAWRAVVPATGAEPSKAIVFMGPGRHLVTYPLRDGRFVNIVAVEERHAWAEEGWAHEDDPETLRSAFAGFCEEARALLGRVETTFLWGLFRHRVALEWHRGRAVLLGDAAHPTLPFMAQGAVMAIEDAWVLADSLAAMGLEDGPALYQARRRHRVERVIEAANHNARNYHLSNPFVRGVGHGILRLAGRYSPETVLKRFDWIYGHDVTTE